MKAGQLQYIKNSAEWIIEDLDKFKRKMRKEIKKQIKFHKEEKNVPAINSLKYIGDLLK